MKIVCTDNYACESVAERLVAENIANEQEARIMADALNAQKSDSDFYVVRADHERLWRGMEELV
jgi:hypothetical protein